MKKNRIQVILIVVVIVVILVALLLKEITNEKKQNANNVRNDDSIPSEEELYATYAMEDILNAYTEGKTPKSFGGVYVLDTTCYVMLTSITDENKEQILKNTQRDDIIEFLDCRFSMDYLHQLYNKLNREKNVKIVKRVELAYDTNCVKVYVAQRSAYMEMKIRAIDTEGEGAAFVFEVYEPPQYEK